VDFFDPFLSLGAVSEKKGRKERERLRLELNPGKRKEKKKKRRVGLATSSIGSFFAPPLL